MWDVFVSLLKQAQTWEVRINKLGREVISILETSISGPWNLTQECLSSSHESRIRLPLYLLWSNLSVKGAVRKNTTWIMTWTSSQKKPQCSEVSEMAQSYYTIYQCSLLLITPNLNVREWKLLFSSLVSWFLLHCSVVLMQASTQGPVCMWQAKASLRAAPLCHCTGPRDQNSRLIGTKCGTHWAAIPAAPTSFFFLSFSLLPSFFPSSSLYRS